MIGHVISGRYVVQAVVGTGGMAVVYRAFDKKKNRIVAIKVLRPEYESDEEFVRRFSREAEAASKVSHENIVNMLDVGIDGDMRYIVMEYVDGQTLKEMIRQRGTIHPDTAIRMAIRILAAVDHAHRNGIVHRDIKPQNIMVDNQGRVKVADFGIARLKASQATTTEEGSNGSVLGSVHYFSPEQARGEVADEKSDLYSVGVVMYEMLTGRVPFDGETSVSVALKHVSEEPKSMRDHQEGISKALDEVVMRALCKDASKRYQTAAEMAADLRKSISHPQGGFVVYPKDPEEIEREKEERRKKRARDRKKLKRTVIACGVAAVVLLVAGGIWYFLNTSNTYVMPDLIGQEQLLAQDALERLGGTSELEYAYSEDYEEGIVIAQSRRMGGRVRTSAQVTLTVSLGTRWYYMYDCVGQSLEEATESLKALGVETVDALYVESDAPVGTVIAVSPEADTTQAKDTPVIFTVSGQRILMPDLSGMPLENAQALLEADGLALGSVTEEAAPDAQPRTVVGQSVSPGEALMVGTTVDITICQGQETLYYPASKLSVVVPLNGSDVLLTMTAPSGQVQEVYHGVLNAGTYRIALSSPESGDHTVQITMDDVEMETQTVSFE